MKSFLIIGMGSFGHQLCQALAGQKCEIMAADKNGAALEDILPLVISAKVGDCTKTEVLSSFGVDSFDTCFVCMGSDFQNSLQITSLLKELGAKRVVSKANEDLQEKFLLRNGADSVIHPERNIAEKIALEEAMANVFEYLDLGNGYFVMEIAPRREWLGRCIGELDIRGRYGLNIIAVKVEAQISLLPDAAYRFSEKEHLLVIGTEKNLKFCRLIL